MKTIKCFLALFLSVFMVLGCSDQKIIELSLKSIDGYGPFYSAKGGVAFYEAGENSPWVNTHLKISALPVNLTDIKIGDVDTDIYQTVYQSYLSGLITKEWYEELQKSWSWIPDTLNMSKGSLKTKIAFAVGTDAQGLKKLVVDANNNLDLSDDDVFPVLDLSLLDNAELNADSLLMANAINVMYEKYTNNTKTKLTVPLLIGYYSQYNIYMANFAQYSIVEHNGEKIAVIPNDFTNLSYSKAKIIGMSDTLDQKGKIPYENLIAENEFIEIGDQLYKNLGVNKNKNCLMLERINLPKNELISTQIGFKAPAISGHVFKADTMPLLQGKYVLVDFWATWCTPCKQEFPYLKELYAKTDRSKFEILGIIGDSSEESIEQSIEHYSIDWPQIQSDDINNLNKTFGINGYPTTFLINPEGVIVAKNLRGINLENKVLELLK